MTSSFRRSILSGSVAALAVAGFLSGCQKTETTTRASDGATTTTTTTTTIAPSDAATSAGSSMRAAAAEAGAEASQAMGKIGTEASKAGVEAGKAMSKAGDLVEDSVITAKVKTALLADPDVKGLRIDVDTKDGVVTLKGTADNTVNLDRAVRIAKEMGGVKSVDNQLVVKSAG